MTTNKLYTVLVLPLLLLSLLSILVTDNAYSASNGLFYLKYVLYESSSGEDVYPGSSGSRLVVGLQYNGTVNASSIYACLTLPDNVFDLRNPCSPAYNLQGDAVSEVSPGDLIEFKYSIDVSRNATPGTYTGLLNITYRLDGNTTIHTQLINISLTIHPLPPLMINVVDAYWSPMGYPGSSGVSLVVVIENTGDSTIINGETILELPSKYFEPSTTRTSINGLAPDNRASLVFNNIFIKPDTQPGNYTLKLTINALTATNDNVRYNSSTTIYFNVSVDQPPPLNMEIIDHGLTTNTPYNGISYTRIYTTLRLLDQVVIEKIYARIILINTVFENKSNIAYVVLDGPYNYGDVYTITTPRIVINQNTSRVIYRLELEILCSSNGVEFWNKTTYTLYIELVEPNYRIYVTDYYWSSNKVYPGSTGETLHVQILNLMNNPLTTVYAKLELPGKIFNPDTVWVGPYSLNRGSITRISFNNIDITPTAHPGSYVVNLTIYGVLLGDDNSFINVTLSYKLVLSIDNPNITVLDISYTSWTTGKAYSGLTGTGIRVVVTPSTQLTILSGILELVMPNGVSSITTGGNTINTTLDNPLNYGEYREIVFQNIKIHNNTYGLQPFALKTYLLVSINGGEAWINETHVFHLYIDTPRLNITVLDTGWIQDTSSNYMDNAGVYVLFRSDSLDTIRRIHAVLYLPEGVTSRDRSYIVEVVDTPIQYSEIYTLSFTNIHVNTSNTVLVFHLVLEAVMERGNALYYASRTIEFTLNVSKNHHRVIPVDIYTVINGEESPLLPNSRGVDLRITLLNTYTDNIRSLIARIESTDGIKARNPVDLCNGLAGGSTCTLNYLIDVGDIKPGEYRLKLGIEYFIDTSGSIILVHENYTLTLKITDPDEYAQPIALETYYWGSTTPIHVYPGDAHAPLTLVFINKGYYTVTTPVVMLKPLDSSIKVLGNNIPCQNIIPGGVCSITFYLDLRRTEPGLKTFNVELRYQLRTYGSVNNYSRNYVLSIDLPGYDTLINNTSILLTSSGWLNNWPVYPNSRDAVYTVTMANLYPYTVSSIYAELVPPEGFKASTSYSLRDYVPGPVAPLQEYSLSFTMDIGSVEPGEYYGLLRIDLYVETRDTGFRIVYEYPVLFKVSDPGRAVEVYQYGWLGLTPTPDQLGARYYVFIRDNDIPSMKGLLLTAKLPMGVYTASNTSLLNTTPSTIIPATMLSNIPSQGIPVEYLLNLYQAQQSLPSNPVLSPGDIAGFTLQLNLRVEKPGTYIVNSTLVFIDHWGRNYYLNISFPLVIYDKPLIFQVEAPTHIVVVNGTAKLHLRIINPSSFPIYNVYVILAPVSPTLIPVTNTRYYDTIEPGDVLDVEYLLVYNTAPTTTSYPAGFTTGFSSGVFTLAIIYRDQAGMFNVYNTTIPVVVKPFIDVELSRDTNAVYRNGVISINGIVINYGVETARSVEVIALYHGSAASTFIGDIDPASQAAFRIDLGVEDKPPGKVTLLIMYRDNYNTTYTKTYELNITIETTSETITPTLSQEYDYRTLVIGMVALFLILVFYIIYRLAKQYSKRLGAE